MGCCMLKRIWVLYHRAGHPLVKYSWVSVAICGIYTLQEHSQ